MPEAPALASIDAERGHRYRTGERPQRHSFHLARPERVSGAYPPHWTGADVPHVVAQRLGLPNRRRD